MRSNCACGGNNGMTMTHEGVLCPTCRGLLSQGQINQRIISRLDDLDQKAEPKEEPVPMARIRACILHLMEMITESRTDNVVPDPRSWPMVEAQEVLDKLYKE